MVLMLADSRYNHLDTIRNALSVVVYPVRVAVDSPFSAYDWLARNAAQRKTLRQDNEALRAENLIASFRFRLGGGNNEIRCSA